MGGVAPPLNAATHAGSSSHFLPTGLEELLSSELTARKEEYNTLCAIQDPEEEPYKSKYAARDLMVLLNDSDV